jgi:hypothetical protein
MDVGHVAGMAPVGVHQAVIGHVRVEVSTGGREWRNALAGLVNVKRMNSRRHERETGVENGAEGRRVELDRADRITLEILHVRHCAVCVSRARHRRPDKHRCGTDHCSIEKLHRVSPE